MSCVCHSFTSVHCCLVVTCWERADLLALVCDVHRVFVTFPCGILGPVWYLILSYDVASESEITPCNKIDKPLVVYRFTGNVITSKTTLRK